METIFPDDTGFAGFFLIGFRKVKDPATGEETLTQRTGTVLLKRTYDVSPSTGLQEGTLVPSIEALPIFMKDQPDNLLINSDFELSEKDFGISNDDGKPAIWQADGVTMALAAGKGVVDSVEPDLDTALQVTGTSSEGIVTQDIEFADPLGGRRFRFSFSVKTGVTPARIEGAQLKAGAHTLCQIDGNLTSDMVLHKATGIWPADVEETKMQVVLPIAFDPDHPDTTRVTYYDRVQVEERFRRTEWNDNTVLLIEHDLAPYKPKGDLIVLAFATVTGQCAVHVDSTTWLQRNITTDRQKALFGWEPRVGSAREDEAGSFSDDPNHYPPEWPVPDDNANKDPLPADFQNVFYNGYRRDSHLAHEPPYLLPTDLIEIERDGDIDYAFRLHSEAVSATYYYYRGTGPDKESHWQREAVTMNLDTLVIEPDMNRCYVVWRGAWDLDKHPEDAYRRLVVSVEEA